MKRIVIIGGGITGLAAAHRILERCRELGQAVDLTILEATSRLGGIVQTRARDGFLLECGPDSFISEKPAALKLVQRLGLESHLIETNEQHRRSFVVRAGRLLPVPEGFHLLAPARFWPFVSSEIFSWSGKTRMALDLLLPRRKANGSGADESLAQFVLRRFGREALERMAQPMVGGIYTADPERLSLRATMPRFLEMEREHRSVIRALRKQHGSERASGARYSLFLSLDRGMQLLTDQLVERISDFQSQVSAGLTQTQEGRPQPRNAIGMNRTVKSLALVRTEGPARKWSVTTNGAETIVADAVCLALPAYAAARLLGKLDQSLADELEGIPYESSTTINLAYRRSEIPHALDGFGFVVPFVERRTVIACTFSSVKFAGRAPDGQVLLRAFVGGALQPEMFQLSDEELLARVRADLRDLLGVENAPLFAEVARWERSMPQYHLGHLERVKRIEERVSSLPGLTLAGNAYSGPGIPDCIRSGESAAEAILRALC
ncbi:MAG: protoporphyrinogen/coproporphyrinogen oxidase [Pyrinomonadaceae bacterium]|jgi:oxygen-dependent protoporphyrinogen oxidase|nr:protoporphyrinogen/coproporphyrinogen oxidase [Pyrinomonadaceae bacterium]